MSETAPTMRFPPVTLLRSVDFLVRSEGLEPPRFYSLPPQGSASTNSATSAWETGSELRPDRINGADVTNQGWRDKACQGASSGAGKTPHWGRQPSGCRAAAAAFA